MQRVRRVQRATHVPGLVRRGRVQGRQVVLVECAQARRREQEYDRRNFKDRRSVRRERERRTHNAHRVTAGGQVPHPRHGQGHIRQVRRHGIPLRVRDGRRLQDNQGNQGTVPYRNHRGARIGRGRQGRRKAQGGHLLREPAQDHAVPLGLHRQADVRIRAPPLHQDGPQLRGSQEAPRQQLARGTHPRTLPRPRPADQGKQQVQPAFQAEHAEVGKERLGQLRQQPARNQRANPAARQHAVQQDPRTGAVGRTGLPVVQ